MAHIECSRLARILRVYRIIDCLFSTGATSPLHV